MRATKKTSRKKATPAPRTRWRRVACPRPEPTPVPTPPAPEWVNDDRFMSAWRSLFPSRERDDAEIRRERDLLTSWPPFLRGQGKSKRRRARDSRGLRLLSDEQIAQRKAHYGELLDKDQKSYRKQQTAAKEVTAFLGLLEESWQTVEDQIVVPVLHERKLKPAAKAKK